MDNKGVGGDAGQVVEVCWPVWGMPDTEGVRSVGEVLRGAHPSAGGCSLIGRGSVCGGKSWHY